ncbi:hypothetical protein HRJ45_23485 [Vibrio coralliilyticus]|uniref:hypothetical protein n=1 Tax=Vibrio coralliilyticus TaxID=190893 RepID=UPI00156051EA|nr:hypothetical protein [Vibrio coralliilyticus]NRF27960.1 hypothetical protein [Vibrio coralliilyticus]NRF82078.1 hypothetical protein [Vibrio coralliilyticus]
MKKLTLSLSILMSLCGAASVAASQAIPYKDITLQATGSGPEDLVAMAESSNAKGMMLSFIVASAPGVCEASWGASYSVDSGWAAKEISALVEGGYEVGISFGGAANTYLAQACGDPVSLSEEYLNVIETYNIERIDFDIENGAESDPVVLARMMEAISIVQSKLPNMKVEFTLAAAPDLIRGFDTVIKAVKENSVSFTHINPMTMSFGQYYHDTFCSDKPDNMGCTAYLSTLSVDFLKNKLSVEYPDKTEAELYKMTSMIPMNGLNDLTIDYITLDDMEALVNWANGGDSSNGNHAINTMSFWSLNRDKSCEDTWVSPTCSSVNTETGLPFQAYDWEYTDKLNGFISQR